MLIKNNLYTILTIILLSFSVQNIYSKQIYKVNTDGLNRRTCPNTKCGIVGKLEKDKFVLVHEIIGNWARTTEKYNSECSGGYSKRIVSGEKKCTKSNGIINGKLSEWIFIKYIGPVVNSSSKIPSNQSTSPMSKSAKEMLLLYEELQSFKNSREFLSVGFSQCCKYFTWLEKVKKIDKSEGANLFREIGIGPMQMFILGTEYYKNKGKVTQFIIEEEERFKSIFSPTVIMKGNIGSTVKRDIACKDLEPLEKFMSLMGAGKYMEADKFLYSDGCKPIEAKNRVTGPYEIREVALDDKAEVTSTYYKVKFNDSSSFWTIQGHVEFSFEHE